MAIVHKKLTGIDIGSKNVKMVKVNKKGKITRHAYSDIPIGVIENGTLESPKILTDVLKRTKKNLKSHHKECAITISTPDTIIRQIFIPIMEEKNLMKNIELEIAGYLPSDPAQYVVDYIITDRIETQEKRQFAITVFALLKEVVSSYSKCVKDAGFKVKYIDIMENANQKLHKFLYDKKITEYKNFACLYVDNSKASISVYSNGKLFINKILDNGISGACDEIAEKSGKPIEVVKKGIYTNNVFEYGETFAIEKNIIENLAKDISYEVTRVIDYFISRNKEEKIDIVYLSGGVAHIMGIENVLEENVGIKVKATCDFLQAFHKKPPKRNTGIDFSNAYAITKREVGK